VTEFRRVEVNLVDPLLSLHRKLRNFFQQRCTRTYAIEVAADYVDDFDIPETEICDQWESEDGSIVFVVRSKKELRGLSQIVKGIVGVTRM
jgi:hypothetical protein